MDGRCADMSHVYAFLCHDKESFGVFVAALGNLLTAPSAALGFMCRRLAPGFMCHLHESTINSWSAKHYWDKEAAISRKIVLACQAHKQVNSIFLNGDNFGTDISTTASDLYRNEKYTPHSAIESVCDSKGCTLVQKKCS